MESTCLSPPQWTERVGINRLESKQFQIGTAAEPSLLSRRRPPLTDSGNVHQLGPRLARRGHNEMLISRVTGVSVCIAATPEAEPDPADPNVSRVSDAGHSAEVATAESRLAPRRSAPLLRLV